MKRIITVFLLTLVLINTLSFGAESTDEFLQDEIEQVINWKKESYGLNPTEELFSFPFLDSVYEGGSSWFSFSIGRVGTSDNYKAFCIINDKHIKNMYRDESLSSRKATDWHRNILVRLSLGCEVRDIEGIDLISDGIIDRDGFTSLDSQGINGLIWALISIDSGMFPDDSNIRKELIDDIISRQNPDGGFSLKEGDSDIDLTAMAVTAFSPYYDESVRKSIDKALLFISESQTENGGFKSWGSENVESAAQVLIAITSLGIDPTEDDRFIKNGNTILDFMNLYRMEDGGYIHSKEVDSENPSSNPNESNSIASEQALQAYISLYRMRNNLRRLYDIREEFDDDERVLIAELNGLIRSLDENSSEEEIGRLREKMALIPDEDKSYIRDYEKYLILTNDEPIDFYKVYNSNEFERISPVNIFNRKEVVREEDFSSDDIARVNEILTSMDSGDYLEASLLLERAKKSDAEFVDELEKKVSELKIIKEKIESINSDILTKLFPIEELERSDIETVDDILLRISELPEESRYQVNNIDELNKAKARISTNTRESLVLYIILGVSLLLVILFIYRYRIKKRKKNEI